MLLVPKGVGGALLSLTLVRAPKFIVKAATIFRSSTASHQDERTPHCPFNPPKSPPINLVVVKRFVLASHSLKPPPKCRSEARPRPSSSSKKVANLPLRPPLPVQRIEATDTRTDKVNFRDRHLTGQRPDRLQHQCVSSGPGHHQVDPGSLRW